MPAGASRFLWLPGPASLRIPKSCDYLAEAMENEKKPTIIRLTKEFTFEAAHALEGYDGLCREIHGHSYRLFVTVKGTPCADESNPEVRHGDGFRRAETDCERTDPLPPRPCFRHAPHGRKHPCSGTDRLSLRPHRAGRLSAYVREYARGFRRPHRSPTCRPMSELHALRLHEDGDFVLPSGCRNEDNR